MQKKSAVHHFIDEERTKGKSDTEIRHQLLDGGWHMDVIKHAMEGKSHDHPVSKHTPIQSPRWALLIREPVFIAVTGLIVITLIVFLA